MLLERKETGEEMKGIVVGTITTITVEGIVNGTIGTGTVVVGMLIDVLLVMKIVEVSVTAEAVILTEGTGIEEVFMGQRGQVVEGTAFVLRMNPSLLHLVFPTHLEIVGMTMILVITVKSPHGTTQPQV